MQLESTIAWVVLLCRNFNRQATSVVRLVDWNQMWTNWFSSHRAWKDAQQLQQLFVLSQKCFVQSSAGLHSDVKIHLENINTEWKYAWNPQICYPYTSSSTQQLSIHAKTFHKTRNSPSGWNIHKPCFVEVLYQQIGALSLLASSLGPNSRLVSTRNSVPWTFPSRKQVTHKTLVRPLLDQWVF